MTKPITWISILLVFAALSTLGSPPNLERALDAQQLLMVERPNDPQVHNDLGNLLVLDERWDEAAEAYRHAIELAPGQVSARYNLALLDEQRGQLAEALRGLEKIVDMAPRHGRAYYQLGVIHQAKGDRKKALEAYAKAFASDPRLSFASNNPHIIENDLRTEALLIAGRYDELAETQPPRVYGEPERIRDLMILRDQEEIAEAAEPPMSDDERPDPQRREALEDDDDDVDYEATNDEHSASSAAEERAPRVLTRESLDNDSKGSSSTRTRRRPAGVGSGSSGYRPSSGTEAPKRDDGGAPAGSVTRVGSPRGETGDSASEAPPPRRRTTPRPRRTGRVGYSAGGNSTGRLDLELLPKSETAEPVTVAARRR